MDKLKKILAFFKTKLFLYNFIAAVVIFIVIYFLLVFYLNTYTHHAVSVTVPTLVGMQADEAISLIEDNDFKYKITDTVYDNKHDKGAIVEQNPKVGSLVKPGRRIYLIVNSKQDELISMPQLTGYTMRQVQSTLDNYGLKVGKLKYVPDIATNVVIRQLHKGEEIMPGEKIKKGSQIDLILGLGISDETTKIPNLIGLSYKEASAKLLELYLNTGSVKYDVEIKTKQDSLKAKVYKQSPNHSTIREVNLGYNVDIWLTKDKDLVKNSKETLEKELKEEIKNED